MTAYGLAVEHYQKDEVIWSGQGGTDIFFQHEMPYDPPSQSAWMATPSVTGQVRHWRGDRAAVGIHGRPSVSMTSALKKPRSCLAAVDR